MRPKSYTVASQSASTPFVLDHRAQNFQVSLGCDLSAGATLTYTVQYTFDDPFAPGWNPATANWQNHPTLAARTVSDASNLAFPARAVRINVTAYTSGSVRFTIIQATGQG